MTPKWFCCGWRSAHWCALDYFNDSVLAALHMRSLRICERHDRAITGESS